MKYTTKKVSNWSGKRHTDVIKVVENLISDLKKLKHPISLMAEEFVFNKKEKEYKGQKYYIYTFGHKEFLLLCFRLRSEKSFVMNIATVLSNIELENTVMKLNQENTKKQVDIKELSFYKRIWDLHAGIMGSKEYSALEAEYQKDIVKNFQKIFPKYTLVGEQVKLPDGDIVDILAKEKQSGRDVIIEIKLDGKSAHKQLRSYGCNFQNPILINLSQKKPNREIDGIFYKVY